MCILATGWFAFRANEQAAVVRSEAERAGQAEEVARSEAERARQAEEVARSEAERARQAEREGRERAKIWLKKFGATGNLDELIEKEPNLVEQSLQADSERDKTASARAIDKRKGITIQYFPKYFDDEKVNAALQELGFQLKKSSPLLPNIPTNAIWFGNKVDFEDAKLVAFTLIRAGVQIKCIAKIIHTSTRASTIQIGSIEALEPPGIPALAVEEIRDASPQQLPLCRTSL
jgi:hypothetical protein